MQCQKRLQLGDAQALGVDGAAPPEVAVLFNAGQGIHIPVGGVSGDNVDMMQQYQCWCITARQPGPDIASSRG